MKRDYSNIEETNSVKLFVGKEVEKTPAYGRDTLFVVGLQDIADILRTVAQMATKDVDITHIYLGANKSFHQDAKWRDLVDELLHKGYWVTLDYPIRMHSYVMRILNQEMRHSRFIPMISVEIPNIEAYNYNTVVKIDDVSIDYSNPGVWCHRLHDLMDRESYTTWDEYKDDTAI